MALGRHSAVCHIVGNAFCLSKATRYTWFKKYKVPNFVFKFRWYIARILLFVRILPTNWNCSLLNIFSIYQYHFISGLLVFNQAVYRSTRSTQRRQSFINLVVYYSPVFVKYFSHISNIYLRNRGSCNTCPISVVRIEIFLLKLPYYLNIIVRCHYLVQE